MDRVLVTGGAGFIGAHVVNALLACGMDAVVADNFSTGRKERIPVGVRCYERDIASSDMDDVFAREKPRYVIHLAAQVDVARSFADPLYDATSNIFGTLRILSNCCKHQVEKIVFASSCAVYGQAGSFPVTERHRPRPISHYGLSKLTAERYIQLYHRLYGLRFSILRFANVYGPGQSTGGEGGVVAIFVRRLLEGQTPDIYGDGEQTRDFVFVEDVAAANVLALRAGHNRTINIGHGSSVSINELLAQLAAIAGTPVVPVYRAPRAGDIRHSSLNGSLARQVLGWEQRNDLPTGLRHTVDAFRSKEREYAG